MDTTATLFPEDASAVVELGEGLWRKQILPFGSILHKNGTMVVDEAYCKPILEAFRAGAFSQIPLQLADSDNKHTDDPERFRGEIKGLELTPSGLEAIISTTARGTEIVRENPKLGVSVRVLDGYTGHDGRAFKRVLHHVLATLSPRVNGMGNWSAIGEFADLDIANTVDLTDTLPVLNGVDEPDGGETVPTDTELSAATIEETVVEVEDVDQDEVDRLAEEALAEYAETQLEQARADQAAGDGTGDGKELAIDTTQYASSTELAELRRENNNIRQTLATERGEREAEGYMRDGVPPAIVQLALPLLTLPSVAVVELSDGTEVSPVGVVRAMLNECKGMVELGIARGHETGKTQAQSEDDLLAAWVRQDAPAH